jgi:hypothetical protein
VTDRAAPPIRVPGWMAAVAIFVFAVYSACFLYFFVDDEAIPYVYAQNVLAGRGLTYTTLEGPLEGYSDFLHVGVSTVILATVKAFNLPKIDVFFIGKAGSFLGGIGVVVVVWLLLHSLGIRRLPAVAALAFIASCGPLAVWSCSSLETVPFTLGVLCFVWALAMEHEGAAITAGTFLQLERIDGFVFAGVALAAFVVVADSTRRRVLLRRIVLPLLVVACIYNGWRWWYFGELLPAPLRSKVLYKLVRPEGVLVKAPAAPYWRGVLDVYGWPAGLVLAACWIAAVRRGAAFRAVALTMAGLALYVSVVGDWMFGLRFFVPVLPLAGLVLAAGMDAIGIPGRRLMLPATLAVVGTCAFCAVRFERVYEVREEVPNFLAHPSRDPYLFFHSYYGLYETARRLVHRDDVISYNQAGFVPFMLHVENIDTLGICSRFYAGLPSTDVLFTEVGRYAPLTDHQALRAADAYLLYSKVRFVFSRTDLLLKANHGQIPSEVVGGYFHLLGTDEGAQNAMYVRTSGAPANYTMSPDAFYENLAHVARVRYASVNGTAIPLPEVQTRLSFLRDARMEVEATPEWSAEVRFGDRDERVSELTIEQMQATAPADVELTLWSADNRLVYRTVTSLDGVHGRGLALDLGARLEAARLDLRITTTTPRSCHVWIEDLRVQGQSQALERYVGRALKF